MNSVDGSTKPLASGCSTFRTLQFPFSLGRWFFRFSHGACISLKAIYLFNALEPVLSSVGGCTACPGACSVVAVRGWRSVTGEPMIARNFDYLPLVQPYYMLRDSRPQGKHRSFEFTTAPLAGAVDGMNDTGLCITYNYAFTTDSPSAPAAPIPAPYY